MSSLSVAPVDSVGAWLVSWVDWDHSMRVGVMVACIVAAKRVGVEKVQRPLLASHKEELIVQDRDRYR